MRKKHSTLTTVLLVVAFFAGLSLLLYPSVSDYWNSMHQTKAINAYNDAVAKIKEVEYDLLWEAAEEYNKKITERSNIYLQTEAEKEIYPQLLDLNGTGMIGFLEIPAIEVEMPVYHGTSASVLQIAAGHVEWTSLPTGGNGTHCVLSGHRGLPSAKLFTDLVDLMVGDKFVLRVLNRTMTYEVDQILTVLPDDTSALQISEDEDYCTLVTCTPYGINTHRFLVRGHRVENDVEEKKVYVTADAIQIEPVIVAPVVALPLLSVLLLWLIASDRRRKRN